MLHRWRVAAAYNHVNVGALGHNTIQISLRFADSAPPPLLVQARMNTDAETGQHAKHLLVRSDARWRDGICHLLQLQPTEVQRTLDALHCAESRSVFTTDMRVTSTTIKNNIPPRRASLKTVEVDGGSSIRVTDL
ncbi:hypothetical protein GN244_ATG06262 [Phytophthora infestans]|uniref:Uncharacterized protein n=1 Tax=Phytophthora infestans TaxID=4787 RepID=A0A833WGT5_PHYIN|nr:hypothetical protein GN244_ATG06262 [Phytophthora infestans]